MIISHLVALSNNFVIGVNNELPWKLKKDLQHFSSYTQNKAIVMGRKTYESIGKPLKDRKNIKIFLAKEKVKNIKEIRVLNLWVVRQFKGEYNPIHYHEGDLSGVGYLTLPKNMTKNILIKNKKIITNGTIDFINGQKAFLSNSIYNLVPKTGDLIIFPNYLMHTAYPFNINGERRSFSFNVKIIFRK